MDHLEVRIRVALVWMKVRRVWEEEVWYDSVRCVFTTPTEPTDLVSEAGDSPLEGAVALGLSAPRGPNQHHAEPHVERLVQLDHLSGPSTGGERKTFTLVFCYGRWLEEAAHSQYTAVLPTDLSVSHALGVHSNSNIRSYTRTHPPW